MISREKVLPRKLGIDRPSIKFLNFLQKYYGLKDYVPQNNNFVVFKDYFTDEPQKRDKYDIYNHNYNYNSTKKDNYNYNYNSNSKNNILTQRKLGKFNQINNNENISYNNSKNYEELNQKEKDKDFTTRIYREYYNKPNEDAYQKGDEQKKEKEKEKEDENESHYKLKQKKSFGYNQYQSSSSEYGAFFHMNK